MGASSWAGIITAVATLMTALGGLLLAFKTVIPLYRTAQSTHKIVNQQRTDMLRYQRALIKTLQNAGIDIPDDQSIDVKSEEL